MPRKPRQTQPKSPANKKIAEREAFKLWLAMPSWERKPSTQTALAGKLGVNDTVMSDWKNELGFMDEVHALARRWAKQFLPDVFGAMVHVAADRLGGTAQDRKLFLQYFEDWAPRERQEVTGADGSPLAVFEFPAAVTPPKDAGSPPLQAQP